MTSKILKNVLQAEDIPFQYSSPSSSVHEHPGVDLLDSLISFVIGVYELQTHAALDDKLLALRRQAGAKHLQLAFTVSPPIAPRHPGCLVVLGDLNANYIWMPIDPKAPSRAVHQVDAHDVADNGATLAMAAAFIRARLHTLSAYHTMSTINQPPGTSSRLSPIVTTLILHPLGMAIALST